MLSAVAARKARLEGKQVPLQVVLSPLAKPATTPGDPSKPPTPPPPKRKQSQNNNKPPRKKKKKQHKTAQDVSPRCFNRDPFQEQDNVVIVDGDSDASDEVSIGEALLVDTGVAMQSSDYAVLADTAPAKARAWSPSAPLRDSSDEEEEDLVKNGETVLGVTPVAGPSREPFIMLSTFQPMLNQNMFYLTSEDLQVLDLPSLQRDDASTVIILSPSDTLALLGTYRLTILQGSVSLMGCILAASRTSHHVYAPRSSPIPVLICVGANDGNETPRLPDRVRLALSPGASVVLLQELRTSVERLGLVCRTFESVFLPSLSQSKHPGIDLNLHGICMLRDETSDTSSFVMPPSWEAAVSTIIDHSVRLGDINYSRSAYLVKGPRNTGKSTFAKVLLNALLTRYRRVAFLECDLGQSEFTPAGMVALNIVDNPVFGPAFTHPTLPHASHFVGATSPKSTPSHYLECIQALVQSYNIDVQHSAIMSENSDQGTDDRIADVIPLVVNTMGWTRGLGSDLSLKIEEMVEPSQIFELEVPQAEDTYSAYLSFDGMPSRTHIHSSHGLDDSVRIYRLEAVAPSAASTFFTAADHRALSILSYFHATFPATPISSLAAASLSTPAVSCIARTWDISVPLCARLPYEVDCKGAFDHIFLVGAGMEDVVSSGIVHVLNGAIVGLVQCEPGTVDDLPNDPESTAFGLPYHQGLSPPSPFSSTCRGIALVRSLSHSAGSLLLHVLTPIPPEYLSQVRALVKGELELPVWGMLDFRSAHGDIAGVERDKAPFLRWGKSEGVGAERRRVRRNLMRRGQM